LKNVVNKNYDDKFDIFEHSKEQRKIAEDNKKTREREGITYV
jgi:hypothetical protein